MGGRGSSRFITILHRGGRQNLLQYYSFERKMEGYNPFSALNKLKGFHFILFNADLCLRILSQIRKKVANTFLGGSTQIITILHRRGHWNLLQYYKGGGVFPIYYNITRGRGGSLGTPNLYYVIYGLPLSGIDLVIEGSFWIQSIGFMHLYY